MRNADSGQKLVQDLEVCGMYPRRDTSEGCYDHGDGEAEREAGAEFLAWSDNDLVYWIGWHGLATTMRWVVTSRSMVVASTQGYARWYRSSSMLCCIGC